MKNMNISAVSRIGLFVLFAIVFNIQFINAQEGKGFTITEDLKGNSTRELTLGGSAYLTSGRVGDPVGDGWLRLTEDENNQFGYATLNRSFPSSMGVVLDLEFVSWGGSGADGFSFFLFDATYNPVKGSKPFVIGARGGGLGYTNSNFHKTKHGVSGAYMGVGIDEFGNFGSSGDGKNGGFGNKEFPNTISIRGSEQSSYKFLKGVKNKELKDIFNKSSLSLDKSGGKKRPSETEYYRRIILEILPVTVGNQNKYQVTLRMKISKNSDFKTIINAFQIDEVPPAYLSLGFAASTGMFNNNHEVRNITVTTPGGVRVTKQVDKAEAYVGDELTYTINVFNQDTKDLKDLKFTDLIPEHFQVTSVEFKNNGNAKNSASNYSKNDLSNVSVNLGGMSEGTFIVKGIITGIPDDKIIRNTAKFKANGKTPDLDETNDISRVETRLLNSPSVNCGAPVGAKELTSDIKKITVGEVYRVSKDLLISGSFSVEPGAELYIESGVKLKVTGDFTQSGGIVEVCPTGGIDVNGAANFGGANSGWNATLTLHKKAFFSVTGALTQGDPSHQGQGANKDSKAVINMYDGAFVEVCGTFMQQSTTYPLINYRGVGDMNAYFINKANASGGEGTVVSYSENVNWILMGPLEQQLKKGNAQFCGANATKETCPDLWPNGLTNAIVGKCHEAEGIVKRENCFEDIVGEGFGPENLENVNNSLKRTFTQPGTDAGFVLDIYELDNSFNMVINGTPLYKEELEFQISGTSGQNVRFKSDGKAWEKKGDNIPDIWKINQNGTYDLKDRFNNPVPAIQVVIDEFGNVTLYGKRGNDKPLEELEVYDKDTGEATRLNKVVWNSVDNNHVEVTQNIVGPTKMYGFGYGQNVKECETLTLEKEGVFIDESKDGYAQIGESIEYSFKVKNLGDMEVHDLEIVDPLFGFNIKLDQGTHQPIQSGVSLSGDLNNNGILDRNETWTFTVLYNVTSEDIYNNKGVYNRASVKAVGKLPNSQREIEVLSIDPTPYKEGDEGWDATRAQHTFVPLKADGLLLTNPMIYQKMQ
ncbi:hypothetical protein VSO92_08625 [Myroides pelagicus]|uniref:DUF7507 domain-containing protein n=1 Tax=Myroides pelagicus TaxID=270914 RepID=UPI002DB7EE79|nr:hypothetical protein [Myroides pelagicus]MEC4114171.1 hypothetical protein [Myroides pelagicus]